MASVVVLGALDTKGREVEFLTQLIEARGHQTVTVDTGVLGTPLFAADISRQQVAEAGGYSLDELIRQADRGAAVTAVSKGAVRVVEDLHARRVDAIVAMGGGAGTTVGTAAMRAAARDSEGDGVHAGERRRAGIRRRQGHRDDPGDRRHQRAEPDQPRRVRAGRRGRLWNAGRRAGCSAASPDAPLIAASMFGNTTPCVERARGVLEAQGYELLVFHATGTGGQTMEGLIEAGQISGVLDVTTTEWADELVGGVMSAGPHRLEAAARTGTPAVIAPGCLDMVNFWEPEALPRARARAAALPAQREADAGSHDAGRERATRRDHCQQAEWLDWAGRGLSAASRRLGDLRRREAVPLARGGPGPVRHAEVAAPARTSPAARWTATSTTRRSRRPWPGICSRCAAASRREMMCRRCGSGSGFSARSRTPDPNRNCQELFYRRVRRSGVF